MGSGARGILVAVVLASGLVGAAWGQSSTGPLAVEDRSVGQQGEEGSAQNDQDDALMMLMQELEQYQRETRELRNQVEKLRHRLDQMQEAQRERYLDLDTRINALAEASTRKADEKAASQDAAEEAPERDPEADRQAYQAAKDRLLQRKFDAAAGAFESYLEDFPDGQFRPYAHFWLGEVYRNLAGQEEEAREHFRVVVDEHPDHSKAPAAMYKLATLEANAGNGSEARVTLEKLRLEFPESREADLAKRMLDELEPKDGDKGG
jgi:tol-pal system protein YbgF